MTEPIGAGALDDAHARIARLERDEFRDKVRKGQKRTRQSYLWLAQEKRFATRGPEEVRDDFLAIGAPEFARGVIEAMRHRGAECPLCHSKSMHDWAYKAFARAAGWAGATVNVMVAIWQQLGVRDEQEAREKIELARSGQSLDAAGKLALARRVLEREGWRCLPPEAAALGNGKAGEDTVLPRAREGGAELGSGGREP